MSPCGRVNSKKRKHSNIIKKRERERTSVAFFGCTPLILKYCSTKPTRWNCRCKYRCIRGEPPCLFKTADFLRQNARKVKRRHPGELSVAGPGIAVHLRHKRGLQHRRANYTVRHGAATVAFDELHSQKYRNVALHFGYPKNCIFSVFFPHKLGDMQF